jgi:N-acetylglucosamine-6-phosphate deacetylase
MSNGEVCARHYSSGQLVRVRWKGGILSQIETAAETAAADVWLAPGLIDLQINGFAGIDFQRDGLSPDDLRHATARLRAHGCTQFLFTLITDRWEAMLARLAHVRKLRSQAPELQHSIAGWHVEGPFLSAEPGFCGAHNPAVMMDPTAEHLQQLQAIVGNDRLLLTLAPERRGALEVIQLAVSLGFKVSLGHTNAPAETLRAAYHAGAVGFTHLANGCPQQLDRHDNIIWRGLDSPAFMTSLIPDGIHVSPALFRIVHGTLGRDSIYYTTDAVAPAGAPPGRYTVGAHDVEVGTDQIVRHPGRTNFAGSALTPLTGIERASLMLREPWQSVWDFLSTHPARLMGWRHGLAAGNPANFCLLNASDGRLKLVGNCVHGAWVDDVC